MSSPYPQNRLTKPRYFPLIFSVSIFGFVICPTMYYAWQYNYQKEQIRRQFGEEAMLAWVEKEREERDQGHGWLGSMKKKFGLDYQRTTLDFNKK